MAGYDRPWKSFEDKLQLLRDRGLSVTDDEAALTYLDRLGYYRLSAYWYSFRKLILHQDKDTGLITSERSDEFCEDSTFHDAVQLYVFDKRLRILVLDALERVEVAVRVDAAYQLGERDTFAYMQANELHGNFSRRRDQRSGLTKHEMWLAKYEKILDRSSEEFVAHYTRKYGAPLPIWVAIELWDFGLLSWFIGGMKHADKDEIAQKYGVGSGNVFGSWIRSFNYLRNTCAHHSRLWNRNMVDRPRLPTVGLVPDIDRFRGQGDLLARPFVFLCMLQWMMKQICPASSWGNRVKELLAEFPVPECGKVSVSDIGTIDGWEDWPLWE